MTLKSFFNFKKYPGKTLVFILFCIYLYFPVFLHLDVLPILLWDESLFALRALHILRYGEYMINFNVFENLPDHMNTKLPFTTFFQVLGLKIFGINELGLRLPIAFIFVATVFYTCYFSRKNFGTMFIGVLYGAILVSSYGWVEPHMLRTGDQDVPFACYIFLSVLFFYRFMEDSKSADLVAFTFFIMAALLTKNLLVGLILPALLVYAVYRKSLLHLLKDYRTYLSLLLIILSYVGTIGYLESQYPGFFQRMWEYELMGRYTNEIEGHGGDFFYYFKSFLKEWFTPFGYFMIIFMALPADRRMRETIRRPMILSSLVFICYLIGISGSETKISWYAAPLYPLGALIVSLGGYHLYTTTIITLGKTAKYAIAASGLVLLANSYSDIMDKVYKPHPLMKDHKYGLFINKVDKKYPDLRTFTIVDNNYGLPAFFIKEEFNALDKGYNIDYQREVSFKEGQYVMTCLNKVFTPLKELYDYEMIHEGVDCKLVLIKGEKKSGTNIGLE